MKIYATQARHFLYLVFFSLRLPPQHMLIFYFYGIVKYVFLSQIICKQLATIYFRLFTYRQKNISYFCSETAVSETAVSETADRSISMEAINEAKNLRSRRYRNRRLGEFLKELELTEGRATGIPTIQRKLTENGSPKATIETDEDRTYFLIDIPCHPDFVKENIQDDIQDVQVNIKDQSIDIKIVSKRLSKMCPSQMLKDWLYV